MRDIININNLRAGNYKAYEMLFNEWYIPLCNYANTILRDSEDARDIVQKTFYKLWDKRAEIEIHTSIKSYLYRMVHNECMNKVKQLRIRTEHNEIYAYQKNDDHINDVENTIMKNELEQQVELAMESLPPRCREVFRLSRFQQLSYAEIAKELDISTNTVETQVVKALKILREKLQDYLPLIILLVILNSENYG